MIVMTQVALNDSGDLQIQFKDHCNENVIVYKLSNDSEVEFVDDECVAIVLPNFEQKLNRGHIDRNSLGLQDYWLDGDVAFFNIEIGVQTVNVKLNLSSLKR